MAASTGLPVLQWMQRWTHQQGFPLVNVARSDDGTTLQLTQQAVSLGMHEGPQALLCGVDLETPLELPGAPPAAAAGGRTGGLAIEPQKYAWWIPVTYAPVATGRNSTEGTAVATGDELAVEMGDCVAEAPWPEGATAVKVNYGQFGVFRCVQWFTYR